MRNSLSQLVCGYLPDLPGRIYLYHLFHLHFVAVISPGRQEVMVEAPPYLNLSVPLDASVHDAGIPLM